MVGKYRSGLANDRRAYRYYAQPPICPSTTTISLADIATIGIYDSYGTTAWLLNGNTTISLCQVLEIPVGQTLLPNGFTLNNNGTINIRGTLRNTAEGLDVSGYNSITINNGTINVFSTGTIAVAKGSNGVSATFTNNGVINNYGNFYSQTFGIVNNNSGGIINNYSVNSEGTGGFRLNAAGTLNNVGIFINYAGASIVTGVSGIYNGIIYNYNGGIITNNGVITNAGIINNANGLSSCGVGTINGSGTIINTGTIGTACP